MASVVIRIDTDGTAFHDGVPDRMAVGEEVARILREIAEGFEFDGLGSVPRDKNGNPCGTVEVIE